MRINILHLMFLSDYLIFDYTEQKRCLSQSCLFNILKDNLHIIFTEIDGYF